MKIGIDLGNSVARLAYLNEQGIPEVVSDFEDPSIQATSAMIHIGQRGCLIGERVEDLLEVEPALSIAEQVRSKIATPADSYLDEYGKPYDTVHLTALLFRKLVQDAEKATSDKVEAAIITIPSTFGDSEKRSLSEAAEIAGIPHIEFAHSAVAIAHHYRLHESSSQPIALVFDLGASSFSASIVTRGTDGLTTVNQAAENFGATELDEKLIAILIENYRMAHGIDPASRAQIEHFARELKIELSKPGVKSIRKSRLISGQVLEIYLNRRQIDKMIEPLLQRCFSVVEKILSQASLKASDLDQVLLSGGNSNLASVREFLERNMGIPKEQIKVDQPGFAEAFGAAHLTASLRLPTTTNLKSSTTSAQTLGKDLVVSSLSPGSRKQSAQVIINRDSPLPAKREIRCLTAHSDQTEIRFQWALAGGKDDLTIAIGESVFAGLPGTGKGYPIDLAVTAGADGTFEVIFTDPATGRQESHLLEDRERLRNIQKSRITDRLQNLPINA